MKTCKKSSLLILVGCLLFSCLAAGCAAKATKELSFRDMDYASLFESVRNQAEGGQIESPGDTTYYVDPQTGSDSNDGLTNSTPWQTVQKVNSVLFKPGDRIEFIAGCRPEGTLAIQGSGTEEKPIVVSMYGSGGMPIFAGGSALGTVALYNQEHIHFESIELGTASTKGQAANQGILVINDNGGTLKGITIDNCAMNNIDSMIDSELECGESGGILFLVTAGSETPSNFEDIEIRNSAFVYDARHGISFKTPFLNQKDGIRYIDGKDYFPSKNVVISNNRFDSIDGDAICLSGVSNVQITGNDITGANANVYDYEHAGISISDSDNVQIDHNYIYATFGRDTGGAVRLGDNISKVIVEQNVMHDNEGSLLIFDCDKAFDRTIIRYNISNNDGLLGGRLFRFLGTDNQADIYNNTIYTASGNPEWFETAESAEGSITFTNNILANEGTGGCEVPAVITDVNNNLMVGTSLQAFSSSGTGNQYMETQAELLLRGVMGNYIDSPVAVENFVPTPESPACAELEPVEGDSVTEDLLGTPLGEKRGYGALASEQ